MPTKTQKLNALFDEWEHSIPEYKGMFVRDGIINEQQYESSSPKILFITKEPNNPDQKVGEVHDFRNWWNKGEIKYAFANRLAEWAYGIQHDFPEYDSILPDESSKQYSLQSIALMNLKKSGGGANADYNVIMTHLKRNYSFIHRQIEIISPDIIITAFSTWPDVTKYLFPDIKLLSSGYVIQVGRLNKIKIIDFYHPSSRTAAAASYCLLHNIFKSEKFKKL